MRKHLPEPPHRLRYEVTPEQKIPFKKRLNEKLVPLIRFIVVGCEISAGKSTSEKAFCPVCAVKFGNKERSQPFIADASGQGFGTLADEIARGGAEYKKMSVAAPIVAKASYDREQIASALYFVNANKFVLVTGKE